MACKREEKRAKRVASRNVQTKDNVGFIGRIRTVKINETTSQHRCGYGGFKHTSTCIDYTV